jgi:hypothetical protein
MSRFVISRAILVICGLCASNAVNAGAQTADSGGHVVQRSHDTFSPGLLSAVRNLATTFVLEGGQDDQSAKVQTSFATRGATWVFGLDAKPDDSQPTTALADVTGLSTGTTASAGVSGVMWFGARPLPPTYTPGDTLIAFCKRKQAAGEIASNYKCEHPDEADFSAQVRRELDLKFAFLGTPLIWILEGKTGRQEFDFLQAGGIADTVNHWQSSARAGIGFFVLNSFVSAAAGYKNKYKAADDAQVCVPLTGSPTAQTCTTTGSAAPTQKKGMAFTADVRRLLPGNLAVSVIEGYDGTSKTYSTQIPLYVIPDEKNALVGGIVAGKKSGNRKWSFAVFVGSAFDLSIPRPR